jgi:hypothetical protein
VARETLAELLEIENVSDTLTLDLLSDDCFNVRVMIQHIKTIIDNRYDAADTEPFTKEKVMFIAGKYNSDQQLSRSGLLYSQAVYGAYRWLRGHSTATSRAKMIGVNTNNPGHQVVIRTQYRGIATRPYEIGICILSPRKIRDLDSKISSGEEGDSASLERDVASILGIPDCHQFNGLDEVGRCIYGGQGCKINIGRFIEGAGVSDVRVCGPDRLPEIDDIRLRVLSNVLSAIGNYQFVFVSNEDDGCKDFISSSRK